MLVEFYLWDEVELEVEAAGDLAPEVAVDELLVRWMEPEPRSERELIHRCNGGHAHGWSYSLGFGRHDSKLCLIYGLC